MTAPGLLKVFRSGPVLNLDRDPVMRLLPWLMSVAGFFFGIAMILLLANSSQGSDTPIEQGTAALVIPWTVEDTQNRDATQAIELIQGTKGFSGPRLVSTRERNRLLAPWLGNVTRENLPALPLLITMKVAEPDLNPVEALRARLKKALPQVRLIENREWQNDQRRVNRTLKGFLAGLSLLALAAMFVLQAFTTRIGLKAQAGTIETLQLLGANRPFIKGEFAASALRNGVFGGLLASAGLALVALMAWILIPSNTLAAFLLSRIFTPLLVTLVLIPLLTGLLAWAGAVFGLGQTFRYLEDAA